MSGSNPRRRKHSPAVYRRRRLVAMLLALVVIAAVVWVLVAQPWRSFAATGAASDPAASSRGSSSSPAPAATRSPAPDPTEGSDEAEAEAEPEADPTAEPCIAADLRVEALTDQTAYPAGQSPQLSIRLTNQSATDCTLNVGTSAQAFTISSGPDIWWRSTDCQSEPSDMIVLLSAGQQVTSATPLAWDRTRSSVDTCQGGRPEAAAGGASYHLSVAIGGISSTSTASFQLN